MKEYDRGDGVCRYLTTDNLCAIYENRPLICNVGLLYEKFYSNVMSREEYDLLNSEACASMKSSTNKDKEVPPAPGVSSPSTPG
jgi:Fe-S-cluster containining protein